jgi:hypothetical protein
MHCWLSSPFVPIPERAFWNPRIFIEFGNCASGESGLGKKVQVGAIFLGFKNAMRAFHNLAEGWDPGSHQNK